jgi:hypothetical protein
VRTGAQTGAHLPRADAVPRLAQVLLAALDAAGWAAVATAALAGVAVLQLIAFLRSEGRRTQPVVILNRETARNMEWEFGVSFENRGTGTAYNVRGGVRLDGTEYPLGEADGSRYTVAADQRVPTPQMVLLLKVPHWPYMLARGGPRRGFPCRVLRPLRERLRQGVGDPQPRRPQRSIQGSKSMVVQAPDLAATQEAGRGREDRQAPPHRRNGGSRQRPAASAATPCHAQAWPLNAGGPKRRAERRALQPNPVGPWLRWQR